jgi:hypothetical protein
MLAITAALLAWPFLASTVVAALSYVLPQATVERNWAVPIWTMPQIPIAIAALMLLHYYQSTFAAPSGPRSS